ncbi:MAG: HEPN domain-containing protein [Verrucomicrobiota bacterium]|nr:HEPN domain-containing protein [Verrucomicrobiota bacterium]
MNKQSAKKWLKSALADLKNIEHILEDDFLTHIVAFHSQQCTEKCFKAILELKSKKVPRIHSTINLFGLVKNEIQLNMDKNILIDFDDLYIEARYPGNFGLLPNGKPTKADAETFYKFAKDIYDKVELLVKNSEAN